MIEEIRIIRIQELKQEIKEDLEYAHPDKNKSQNAANAFDTTYGFKPYVDGNFFVNEDEAVKYIFETDAIYQHLKDLEDDGKIIECYDDEKDILQYTRLNETQTIRIEQSFLSSTTEQDLAVTFIFEDEQLCIIDDLSTILTCKQIDDEVCWSEGKSIEAILSKEHILCPENIGRLIEKIWISWKKGESNAEEVVKDLSSLVQWINAMTKTKPSFV
jgi:hypothetical protein